MSNTKITSAVIKDANILTAAIADAAVTSAKLETNIVIGGTLGVTGALTTSSTIDGRDVATDGTKLDGVEASADVTANAGALMDSELTAIASVKALNQGVATGDSPTFAAVTAPSGFLGGSNGGLRIHSGGTKFFNITAGNAARDGIMDIGASDARFKDLWLSGSITADSLTVDNFTLDGTTLALSSGDMLVDVAGNITLDADDAGEIRLKDGGTQYGALKVDSSRFKIQSIISDADMLFAVNDGGSEITALSFDASAAGAATFSSTITIPDYVIHSGNTSTKFGFGSANTMNFISNGSDRLTIANSYAVFNEAGTDYDFRVKSNNLASALFVDGGTGNVTLQGALTTIGAGLPSTNVQLRLSGYGSKATRIHFSEGVTDRWLLGQGAASETSAFELYNSTGTIALKFDRSTNVATFASSVSTPTLSSPDGTSILTLANSGEAQFGRGIVVNEAGLDSDFRVESVAYSSCLHVNAGDNSVNFHKSVTAATTSGFTIGVPASGVTSSMPSGNTYHVYRSDGVDNGYKFYVNFGGQINSTSTSISSLSDERLKENIVDLETGLTEVIALKPRRFDWKGNGNKNVAGFIAQEVETVLPELIGDFLHDDLADAKSVKMGDMVPTLVKAIQEQQTLIESLEARLSALEE